MIKRKYRILMNMCFYIVIYMYNFCVIVLFELKVNWYVLSLLCKFRLFKMNVWKIVYFKVLMFIINVSGCFFIFFYDDYYIINSFYYI